MVPAPSSPRVQCTAEPPGSLAENPTVCPGARVANSGVTVITGVARSPKVTRSPGTWALEKVMLWSDGKSRLFTAKVCTAGSWIERIGCSCGSALAPPSMSA
jgi:hypothetical protein